MEEQEIDFIKTINEINLGIRLGEEQKTAFQISNTPKTPKIEVFFLHKSLPSSKSSQILALRVEGLIAVL